jgi:hypothetical protein
MQISIHNTEKIKTSNHESEGFIWKKIIAYDDKGNKYEIIFFSRKPLMIESDDEVEL